MSFVRFCESFWKKNSYLICLIGFSPLPVFNILSMWNSFKSHILAMRMRVTLRMMEQKKHKESGSPVISWAITPSLDCQPPNSHSTKINKPNLFKPLFSELSVVVAAKKQS